MTKTILPILLVAASVFMYYLFISPTYADIQSLKQEEVAFTQAIKNVEQINSRLDALRQRYTSISSEELDQLSAMLPAGPLNQPRLTLELNNLAQRANMTIRQISIATQNQQSQSNSQTSSGASGQEGQNQTSSMELEQAEITFDVSGQYGQLVAFLQDVEQNLRLLDVRSVNFQERSGQQDDESGYQYTITATVYWINSQNT